MAVKFRREAIKFLQKIPPDDVLRIRLQLNQLLTSIEEQGIIPFTELDVNRTYANIIQNLDIWRGVAPT